MSMHLTGSDLERFKRLVYERSLLSFPAAREEQFKRSLVQRIKEGDFRSPDDYYTVLHADAGEFDRLLSLITTQETYFFRMPEHFEILDEVVLPGIIEREGRAAAGSLARGEKHRMRLWAWSAGCATGQEAYSLAMQIHHGLRYGKAWDVKVLGTDINTRGLAVARQGRYHTLRLGRTPSQLIEKYFEIHSVEEVEVASEVKELTEFRVMNLRNLTAAHGYTNSFDIVFCRNVMIYFDRPAQERLVAALVACLRPGGYFFTGEGEVLHLYDHHLELIEHRSSIFYRKSELPTGAGHSAG
jgi:chemotaxis protein methyltransferase CheR